MTETVDRWVDPLDATQPITPETAREAIEQERRERIQRCSTELEEVLQRHRCQLDVSVLLRDGQVIPQVNVIAED